MPVLPMFPLGSVLLPGTVLPLHVFEPRYRRLVQDCLAADVPEFGVTLIARGSEVGGGDVRTDIGTVARMIQVSEAADGRYAVISYGTRRIRVAEWLTDDPYPRATVEDWPEAPVVMSDGDWASLCDRVHRRVRAAAALAVELGDLPGVQEVDLTADAVSLSHHLVGAAPVGATDRQALLAAEGPVERLQHLERLLDDVDALLAFRLGEAGGDLPDLPGDV